MLLEQPKLEGDNRWPVEAAMLVDDKRLPVQAGKLALVDDYRLPEEA